MDPSVVLGSRHDTFYTAEAVSFLGVRLLALIVNLGIYMAFLEKLTW